MKYAGTARLHEAGYDSFLTARVLIRLSTRLDGREIVSPTPSNKDDPEQAPVINGQPEITTGSDDPSAVPELASLRYIGGDENMFANLIIEEPKNTPAENVKFMMPAMNSEFWSTYANKLRVNGTVEEVCHI